MSGTPGASAAVCVRCVSAGTPRPRTVTISFPLPRKMLLMVIACSRNPPEVARGERGGVGEMRLGRAPAAAHGDDLLSLAEEDVAHGDRLLEESAGVRAEVEHDALRTLGHQALEGEGHLIGRGLVEAEHGDVGRLVLEHDRVRHRGNADHAAGEVDRELLRPGARELRDHPRARRSLQLAGYLVGPPAARTGRIHADDPVAREDVRLGRGRVREDLDDDDEPILGLDGHADARVETARRGVERLALFRRVEFRVRVLELRDQATRGLLIQRAGVHRIHEAFADDREDLIEEPRPGHGCALLDDEAASDDRDNEEADEHGLAGTGHGTPATGWASRENTQSLRPAQRNVPVARGRVARRRTAADSGLPNALRRQPAFGPSVYSTNQALPSCSKAASRSSPAATSISWAGWSTRCRGGGKACTSGS